MKKIIESLETEVLNPLIIKKSLILLILLMYSCFYSQTTLNDFYITNKIIEIESPILVSIKGLRGKFVINKDDYEKTQNIKKLLNEHKAYLYFDDSMGIKYFTNDWFKLGIKKLECVCCDKTNYIDLKNAHITTLSSLKQFYIGFTKISFYNNSIIDVNNTKTYLKNSELYFPILFPKCHENIEGSTVTNK